MENEASHYDENTEMTTIRTQKKDLKIRLGNDSQYTLVNNTLSSRAFELL